MAIKRRSSLPSILALQFVAAFSTACAATTPADDAGRDTSQPTTDATDAGLAIDTGPRDVGFDASLTDFGPPDPCSVNRTCATCAGMTGCGWCFSSNYCITGTAARSMDNACSGANWAPTVAACTGGTGCSAPMTMCGTACVDTSSDNVNCGMCGRACTGAATCSGGTCGTSSGGFDNRAGALPLTLTAGELTVTGTTTGATHDGPTVPCLCTSGPNVWYRFTLTQREVVYADTAGTGFDTSLFFTDAAGAAVPAQTDALNTNAGLCNDDAACTTGGFTSANQSQTAGVFAAGTYYLAVGGCASGSFTLHVQHFPTVGMSSYFYTARITGAATTASTPLVGTSAQTSTCGGMASGEDARWFLTCGATMQSFSLCQDDGGSYTRTSGSTSYDPAMYVRSAQSGAEVICNDDGTTMRGGNCQGTGGDSMDYGPRLDNVVVPRGLNVVFVDERTGGSGMTYTMRHTIR